MTIQEQIIAKQDEIITESKKLINLCDAPQYYEIIEAKKRQYWIVENLESELSVLKAQAGQEKVTDVKTEKNPECKLDLLEFNCGYNNPCVDCSNYIPYVKR